MSHLRIDYVDDWFARLKSRLYTQFRNSASWIRWCSILGRQFQDIEDATQSLFSLLSIDESEGTQLDLIGRIVGQPRTGQDDETYRIYLRARILANKSDGSSEDLYDVIRAVLDGAAGNTLILRTSPIRTFVLNIGGAITATEAVAAADFLQDAKEAAARGYLEWQQQEDGATFCTENGDGLGFGDAADATAGGALAGAVIV